MPSKDASKEIRRVAHGSHIMLDFTGFFCEASEGALKTMEVIRESVREAGVREVHHKTVVLGGDGDALSPPGFTACVLIDESHVTAHCYSDKGWLAVDVFTCGSHSTEDLARAIQNRLLKLEPALYLRSYFNVPRFRLGEEDTSLSIGREEYASEEVAK